MVVNKAFTGFSKAFREYLNKKVANNEAWLCPKCHNYMPFYVDECYFCGAEVEDD